MRRQALLGVLASVFTFAGVTTAQATTTDSVIGTDVSDGNWNYVLDNIQSGPNGENPTGNLKLVIPRTGAVAVTYPVICLRVVGNLA